MGNMLLKPSSNCSRFIFHIHFGDFQRARKAGACSISLRVPEDDVLRLSVVHPELDKEQVWHGYNRSLANLAFVGLRPPECGLVAECGLHFGRGLKQLLHAFSVVASAFRTNTTWSLGTRRAVARKKDILHKLQMQREASYLPELDVLGYQEDGSSGLAEGRAAGELRVHLGCARRRQGNMSMHGKPAPCLPYSLRLGSTGVAQLSGQEASSLLRRHCSTCASCVRRKHISSTCVHKS